MDIVAPSILRTARLSETEYRSANPERLRIYEIATDEFRDATQADINDFMALKRAYGKHRAAAKAMDTAQAELILDMATSKVGAR